MFDVPEEVLDNIEKERDYWKRQSNIEYWRGMMFGFALGAFAMVAFLLLLAR